MQGETHDALGATHTWAVFSVVALIQSQAKEELPGRWMSLQILPSTWNASDCLLNCSSKRKHWQESVIKMEAKGAAVTFWGCFSPLTPHQCNWNGQQELLACSPINYLNLSLGGGAQTIQFKYLQTLPEEEEGKKSSTLTPVSQLQFRTNCIIHEQH